MNDKTSNRDPLLNFGTVQLQYIRDNKKPNLLRVGRRRKSREFVIQAVYQFLKGQKNLDFLKSLDWSVGKVSKTGEVINYFYFLLEGIIFHFSELKDKILENLEEEEVMYDIDLSILLLGTFSLMYEKDLSFSVLTNECIELAKFYSGQDSYRFINGVLDKMKNRESNR